MIRTATTLLAATCAIATAQLVASCANVERNQRFILEPEQTVEAKKDYYRELKGGHALRKITDPAQVPDFTAALSDLEGLDAAVGRSLNYVSKPSSKTFYPAAGIGHEQMRASLEAFRALVRSGKPAAELNAEIRRRFDVYTSVGCDDEGTVLFTGYYTPIFKASRTRTGAFQHPLYKLPPNHVKDPITGETKGLRRADGSIDPRYPDRSDLESSGFLRGHELVWLADPIESYVVTVQGSAILELTDGSRMEVGYAGTNGHEYKSISLELVKRGKMKREEISLDNVMKHFREHPADFAEIVQANKRFIFFQEVGGGPFGCLNEQVTRLRSIATDKSIFPRAGVCLVTTKVDVDGRGARPLSRFMLDQDAGGAIRAPGRCDIYWGVGPEAQAPAGRTYQEGRLYYLILKDVEIASPSVQR